MEEVALQLEELLFPSIADVAVLSVDVDIALGSVFGCDHQMGRVSSLSQIIEARR
ncbi:hypothetical protein [Streptomyces sp. CC210A]|uniref:hypothetical protein n=1 Tax=Streptomyces sp. CC210A TaxID=2898184 RepID=UPI001F3EFEDD|nr:hypothetical protein [Streptomyces sp. CC210A]